VDIKNRNSESINLLETLLRPEIYPERPQKVELEQTQMSFVFLTGDYAYKVKKPVNLGYLDYTTLEKRHFFCQQELNLNRRLSPDVYLKVVPIVNNGGKIDIGGSGEIIEYAVKMRQLPHEHLMESLLPQGLVTDEMVRSVAEKLANFHEQAETNKEIGSFGKLDMIMINIEENFSQTEKYLDNTITRRQYNRIQTYNADFTRDHESMLQKRVDNGRIRDCHGDLHAAHVCFDNGIIIFDCIEFNDRFRYCDVASEVAFLAMDLDRYRRADLSRVFVTAYVEFSGDKDLLQLLNFYKCYRAYVRGKVESFKLDDPYITEKKRALTTAQNYFNLAYRYTRERPLVLITSGLVGTGKSTIAQALSQSLGLTVISSDIVRKKLAGISPDEHRFDQFESGIYSKDFSRKTYEEMFAQAKALLSRGQSVILDASFKKKQDRLLAGSLAAELKADFLVIECTLDEDIVKSRLEQRLKKGSVSDGRWEIFESQKRDFDKIMEFSLQNHIIVDTSRPAGDIITMISERIYL